MKQIENILTSADRFMAEHSENFKRYDPPVKRSRICAKRNRLKLYVSSFVRKLKGDFELYHEYGIINDNQYRVFKWKIDDNFTISKIAKKKGVTLPTVSEQIKKLENIVLYEAGGPNTILIKINLLNIDME